MKAVNKIPEKYRDWLQTPGLQTLFDVLGANGGEVLVNGGAVRNSLLGEKIGDVDLSTTLEPQVVMERLADANIKAIATGLSHGTVTAVIDKRPYEITTLRVDIETDGRHAVVKFGLDWEADAKRRDLTMNALYCDRDGKLYDPLEGYDDLVARNVRFIGDASDRIKEDYLRILRFFRFFASYGSGRPDADGLKACAREKSGITKLSVERVWAEMKKIFGVQDPSRALLWMRTTGVLNLAIPESEKWGIDFFNDLIGAEQDLRWQIDPIARLQVIVPPHVDKMTALSKRLRLSGREKKRMIEWAQADLPASDRSEIQLSQLLYRGSKIGIVDTVRNEIVRQRHRTKDDNEALLLTQNYTKMLIFVQKWQKPVFVLKGRDLENAGLKPGPQMGETLRRLEEKWVVSGFKISKADLMAEL